MSARHLHTLVIGSGAAGLAAAVRLEALGVAPLAVYTDGLQCGTSINTGSDKQTYYKLGMYGEEADSPVLMARDLMAGGAMHGDIALVEAALSPLAFSHLATLGVPFPCDEFGQYIGYKTDHDPRRRATSCGPYTSREMCRALIAEAKRRGVEFCEGKSAVRLLARDGRCVGAVFADRRSGEFEAVLAENVVFATGGPGGIYEDSVYPAEHTGGIGLALAAGAQAVNLTESQYGLASVKFRWNVSGSYMQALPRFVSVGDDGAEREFLREYFNDAAAMYDAIFLKGYQWPFAAGHLPGSSLVDIAVYVETKERGRRVFLDYRRDPADLRLEAVAPETREYLEKCRALGGTPLARLAAINGPAIELYRDHGIDLAREPLEIAVSAQHCNGGLAGTAAWESVNLKHLFPIGEVNGTHGVTRPGGSALNAGQVGAFRAASEISLRPAEPLDWAAAEATAEAALAELRELRARPARLDWQAERRRFRHAMSVAGAFVRSRPKAEAALEEVTRQSAALNADGLGGLNGAEVAEALRNRQLCLAARCYLAAILKQIAEVGSRGGSLVLAPGGRPIHPKLGSQWRMQEENPEYRGKMLTLALDAAGTPQLGWTPCRPLPESDGWFETVWKEFRERRTRLES